MSPLSGLLSYKYEHLFFILESAQWANLSVCICDPHSASCVHLSLCSSLIPRWHHAALCYHMAGQGMLQH